MGTASPLKSLLAGQAQLLGSLKDGEQEAKRQEKIRNTLALRDKNLEIKIDDINKDSAKDRSDALVSYAARGLNPLKGTAGTQIANIAKERDSKIAAEKERERLARISQNLVTTSVSRNPYKGNYIVSLLKLILGR